VRKTREFAYPLMLPVGPIDVANMRLNSRGSVRSLPETGDFMSYSFRTLAMSSLLIPSI